MRLLILVPSLVRSGAEIQAIDLANGLALRGHAVHLCSFEHQLDQRDRLASSVGFHHVTRVRKFDVTLPGRIATVLDQCRIDVVHSVLEIAALVGLLSRNMASTRPALVAGIHTTVPRNAKMRLLTHLITRRVLRHAERTIFVCQAQRDYWLERFPDLGQRSSVVYNGVDSERFSRDAVASRAREMLVDLGIDPTRRVFACVAAFRPEKNHQFLLQAFSGVSGSPMLLLAGDGPLRVSVERQVSALGLSDRVRFMGNVEDIRPLICAADATVLASNAVETFSIAMLESMSLGVPMIAPLIGGLAEAIEDGETGLLFDVGDLVGLRAAMQRIVDDPVRAAHMGAAGMQAVRSRFTIDRMVLATEAIVLGCVEGTFLR